MTYNCLNNVWRWKIQFEERYPFCKGIIGSVGYEVLWKFIDSKFEPNKREQDMVHQIIKFKREKYKLP